MTATTAALVPIQPAFTDAERFALAVATLPGDSPARDRGSAGIRRDGPVPWLCLVTGWPLLKRPHVAVGVTEI
jgi:hypothetical protein